MHLNAAIQSQVCAAPEAVHHCILHKEEPLLDAAESTASGGSFGLNARILNNAKTGLSHPQRQHFECHDSRLVKQSMRWQTDRQTAVPRRYETQNHSS